MPSLKCIVALVVSASLAALWGQTGLGRIQGTVTDQTGAVIPNAKVVALHVETGNAFGTATNSNGFFIFPSMQIGKYTVTAELPGMEKWQGELILAAGQQAVLAPQLRVGGTATQVTVAGDVTPVVTTTNPTLGATLDRARIEQLPVNGRYFYNLLATTTPGMESGDYGITNAQPYGLRDMSTNFVQDGAAIKDADTGAATSRPPGMDTIQELRMETSVPDARYDSPANVIISTRSGTNLWHGSLFYTGRNNGWGLARKRQDFYSQAPQYIRNEYGASFGGPVRIPHVYNGKDRTFFFAAWEPYSLRSGATMSAHLPTAAMEQGDFSGLTNGAGQPETMYNPWSTGTKAQNYSREPYPGNIIPASELSPLAAYFFKVLPQANQPGVNPAVAANYFGPRMDKENDWTFTTRIDHRLSDRDQIFGRFTYGRTTIAAQRPNNPVPITSDNYWDYQTSGTDPMFTMAVNWNHSFSPTFFVETLATVERIDWNYDMGAGEVTSNISNQLGIPNPFGHVGAPSLTNIGFGLSANGTIPRFENTRPVTAEQNYSKVIGRHQLEFGWRVERMFLDVLPDQPAEGTISFASAATGLYNSATGTAYNAFPLTGDAIANFYLGIAASYSQTAAAPQSDLRSNEISGYVQDNWKVSSNLTLNLGLRYTFLQPLIDSATNADFDFANHAIVRNSTLDQLLAAGDTTQGILNQFNSIGVKFETTQQAGMPSTLVNVGQLNFDPRVGFAYNWKMGGRTSVLRGGFGSYRYNLGTRLFNVQRGNAPLQGTVAYNISSANKSPDGLANYALRNVPTVIAGTNSALNVIDPNAANAIGRGVAMNVFAPNLPTTLAREWNLTFETEIFSKTLLQIAYVGTAGRNLDQTIAFNGQPNNYVWYVTTGQPLPTGQYASVARRDYDQTTYGNINEYAHTGYSNYNGLTVQLEHRFNNGIGFQWFYVLSNTMWVGSGKQIQADSSQLPDPVTFFPGAVPSNFDAYNRFYNYSRDPSIPQHRINWNMLYDLPVGHGKKWLSNSHGLVDRILGGWQIAAMSSMSSRFITLPTSNWGSFGQIRVYGNKYPVQDCRSGTCYASYLYWNGYIPANQINTHNAAGQCNCVCGVPSIYQPADQPVWPFPATINPNDPNAKLYGTNDVYVPMQNGSQQLVGLDTGLNPWMNQYMPGPWSWTVDASAFKVISIKERLQLRFNLDAFNVFNMPGTPLPAGNGLISLETSNNAPRELQWTVRLTW